MTASNAMTTMASNIDKTTKKTELGELDQKLNLVSVLCSRVDSNILCDDCCSKLGSTKLSADILFSSMMVAIKDIDADVNGDDCWDAYLSLNVDGVVGGI